MGGYSPLYIKKMETGLVQNRVEFILPDDAYPVLENAYVWRERIVRKPGFSLLGKLRRVIVGGNLGNSVANQWDFNLYSTLMAPDGPITGQPNAELEPGSIVIVLGSPGVVQFTDSAGDGVLVGNVDPNLNFGEVNYATGEISLTQNFGVVPAAINFNYFPGLPVMGLRSRELNDINNEQTIAFDTVYAYEFGVTEWEEFIPGTVWTGDDSDFFWSTNYWVNASNNKLFWVTNFSTSDPIRYTDGTTWTDFAPVISGFGLVTEMTLFKCLCILPFRGRLVVFNTFEGLTSGLVAGSIQYPQRIRWAQIGNPLIADSVGPPAVVGAWRDDVRGKGGFLDIPTSENIVSVGFVRDNLVIYCERSTWQLRYTGRSIAPFQIEKVNSELGAESTFSAVQFDTSLVGIGDKGVVECDSFKSERIDIKIPDLTFEFTNTESGTKRVHGIRDLQQRLAYWTYPLASAQLPNQYFPNRVLLYNYENDSWGIFTDSFTCFGNYQPQEGRRWNQFTVTDQDEWELQDFPWVNRPAQFPLIVAGNQQGFVEIMGGNLEGIVGNGKSLSIKNITGNSPGVTVIESPNHNLVNGQVIEILSIPTGTPFDNLNNQIFGVANVDVDTFQIFKYSPVTKQFDDPQIDPAGAYIGAGKISVRDNFRIVSKKFNFLDDGQNIQLGYIDILLNNTDRGAITLKVYNDYNDNTPTNTLPDNVNDDTFFNSVVPTTVSVNRGSSKNWQRVFCPTRAAFLTIEWTLSNAQMNGPEQESDVEIDTQILWLRKAGRQLPIGV